MYLKEIRFKNIGSYGNKLYTLFFSKEGEMIQLKGLSGSGKSTLLSLPALLFYGKIAGTNKTAIANRSNKNGYIRGTVLCKDKEYIIERGFTPTYLHIYEVSENGEMVDIENIGSRDGQDFIEKNIVGLTSQMFNSLISLNLNTFKSFITMNNQEKKQIIDKLFNLDIVNVIYQIIKDTSRTLNQTIMKSQSAVEALYNTIKKAEKQIDDIKASNDRLSEKRALLLSQEKINELTETVQALNEKLTETNTIYDTVNGEYTKLRAKDALFFKAYNNLTVKKEHINRDLKEIDDKLQLFSRSKCPTCSADFSGEYFVNIREELEEAKRKIIIELDNISTQENNYNVNKSKYNEMLDGVQQRVNEARKRSGEVQKRIQDISASLSKDAKDRAALKIGDYKPLEDIISRTTEDIDKIQKEIRNNNKVLSRYAFLENIYSENGLKGDIIGTYIPQINAEVQRSLINFGFPYLLEFDNNFTAHLYHLGEEIQLSTLSAGELKRTDIAVLCSLLKLVKQKYPDINFVSFDETLSSIDMQTADEIVRYLSIFAKEEKLSVLIVSHAPLNNEFIDKTISVTKSGLFSELSIE